MKQVRVVSYLRSGASEVASLPIRDHRSRTLRAPRGRIIGWHGRAARRALSEAYASVDRVDAISKATLYINIGDFFPGGGKAKLETLKRQRFLYLNRMTLEVEQYLLSEAKLAVRKSATTGTLVRKVASQPSLLDVLWEQLPHIRVMIWPQPQPGGWVLDYAAIREPRDIDEIVVIGKPGVRIGATS